MQIATYVSKWDEKIAYNHELTLDTKINLKSSACVHVCVHMYLRMHIHSLNTAATN